MMICCCCCCCYCFVSVVLCHLKKTISWASGFRTTSQLRGTCIVLSRKTKFALFIIILRKYLVPILYRGLHAGNFERSLHNTVAKVSQRYSTSGVHAEESQPGLASLMRYCNSTSNVQEWACLSIAGISSSWRLSNTFFSRGCHPSSLNLTARDLELHPTTLGVAFPWMYLISKHA